MNRYYPRNAYLQGWADFATSFGAQRQQNQAIESQLEAQADQQRTGMALTLGTMGLGAIGGLAMAPSAVGSTLDGSRMLADGSRWAPQAFQSALSGAQLGAGVGNVLAGQGPGAFLSAAQNVQRRGEIADARVFETARQERGIQGALQLDVARTNNDIYQGAVEQFNQVALGASAGRSVPGTGPVQHMPASGGGGGGAPGIGGPSPNMSLASGGEAYAPPPGGVAMPVIDPTTIPIYRQAEEDARNIVNEAEAIQKDATIPVAEKAQRLSALTPRLAAAQRMLAPTRQPPPPTTEEELIAGGQIIRSKDGGIYERGPQGYNYKAGPKGNDYQTFVTDASNAMVEAGIKPIEARKEAKRLYMVEQLGGQENYDKIVSRGGVPYLDKEGDVEIWEGKEEKGSSGNRDRYRAKAEQLGKPGTKQKPPMQSADIVQQAKRDTKNTFLIEIADWSPESIPEDEYKELGDRLFKTYGSKESAPSDVWKAYYMLGGRFRMGQPLPNVGFGD